MKAFIMLIDDVDWKAIEEEWTCPGWSRWVFLTKRESSMHYLREKD